MIRVVSKRTYFTPSSVFKDGALAQLGERFAGSEQVSGSIPLGSTNLYSKNIRICPEASVIAGFFVYTVSSNVL